MTTSLSSMTEQQLADHIGAWLDANSPDPDSYPTRETPDFIEVSRAFARKLLDAGLAGLTWPREFGGQGLTPAAGQVYREVASGYDLPMEVFDIGLGMCGPTLLEFGTPEQKQTHLLRMLSGDDIWCQLFSEPGAGSDVAGVRTRAVRHEDGWILNGQKVWTTGAQFCSYGILLARTDPAVPKHRGLTMFIVDLHAPGVTVRPLRDMTGVDHFNEVFFDDVHLPDTARLGAPGDGWKVARFTLNTERLAVTEGVGSNRFDGNPLAFKALAQIASDLDRLPVPGVAEDLLDLYLSEYAVDAFNERLAAETDAGLDPGARGSVGKLLKSQHDQRAAAIVGRVAGHAYVDQVTPQTHAVVNGVLTSPILSLGGGTNEIQLNIIGERVLRLPSEHRVDLDVAFRDLDRRPGEEPS